MSLVLAAGIACVAKHPSTHQMYMLLGKDTGSPEWPRVKNKWSDFAGKPDKEDVDVYETAAREFLEESLGVVVCFDEVQGNRSRRVRYIADRLRRGDYIHRVDIDVVNSKNNPECRIIGQRTCFIIEVPWSTDICDRFQCRVNELRDIIPEKKELEWFKMSQLREVTNRKRIRKQSRCVRIRGGFIPTLRKILRHFNNRPRIS